MKTKCLIFLMVFFGFSNVFAQTNQTSAWAEVVSVSYFSGGTIAFENVQTVGGVTYNTQFSFFTVPTSGSYQIFFESNGAIKDDIELRINDETIANTSSGYINIQYDLTPSDQIIFTATARGNPGNGIFFLYLIE